MDAKYKTYVIVIPSLTLGGAERQALSYAVSIKALGIGHPVIVGLGREGELIGPLRSADIAYRTIGMDAFINGNRWQKLVALARWVIALRALRPHTMIGFTHWPNMLCGLAWRFTGAKRFFWNQRSVDADLPITLWERFAVKMHPNYISNGVAGAAFIAKRHNLVEENVRIIPNVVHLPEVPPTRLTAQNGVIHLLMTANFFPEKDHTTVLRSIAEYRATQGALPVQLHLVGVAPGKSPQLDKIKALAFDLGLCGHVTFHGLLRDMSPLLKIVQIGILSTRSEGVSNAILEYMAHGLPVIASDILANREALGEHNAMWLFPVENIGRLTELLTALIASTDREYIGAANRAYVTLRHSEHEFEKHLNEALG